MNKEKTLKWLSLVGKGLGFITGLGAIPFVPPQTGRPCPDPLNIGIGRIGIEVKSIEAALRLLQQALAEKPCGEARLLGPVEHWDYGDEVPRRKAVALKDPDGMHIDIYEPERRFVASVPT